MTTHHGHASRMTCVVLALLALFALAATNAFADQCDLTICWPTTQAYYFNDTYQTTPSGNQAPSMALENGQLYTWNVRVQNDGASTRTFLLKATGSSGSGWTVTYEYDSTDITTSITGDGWTTPSITATSYITVEIHVTPDATVSVGNTKATRIDAYLDTCDETIDDAVQGTYRVADLVPDLMVRANSETTGDYGIDDTYQATPSGNQIESQDVDGTVGAWFRVRLGNDGTINRYFRVKATGATGSGWTVLIKSGNVDNTSYFTNSTGGYLYAAAGGVASILSIKITPDNTISASSTKDVVLEVYGGDDDTTVRDSIKCTAVATGRHGHYASTTGSDEGDGTIGDPWDLQTALDNPEAVSAGDTIWVRGGTYGSGGSTLFQSRLAGTSAARITVRQYPGERAIIDGGIEEVNGTAQYVTYRDFEITNSSTTRICNLADRSYGMKMYAPQTKAVNLVVHDTGHPAFGYWSAVGDGGEIDGCLIWGTGVYALNYGGQPAGSGIYAQNYTGTRYIRGVVSFRNFTFGIKPYSEGGYADGFQVQDNTVFDAGHGNSNFIATTTGHTVQRLKLIDNNFYRSPGNKGFSAQIGCFNVNNTDAEVTGNYFVNRDTTAGLDYSSQVQQWLTMTYTGNTHVSYGTTDRLVQYKAPTSGAMTYSWDNNTYHNLGPNTSTPFVETGVAFHNFSSWQTSTGYDANSTHSTSAPSTNRITYRQSPYEPGRTIVTIYNWENDDDITIDLSQCGIEHYDRYDIIDAQNYFGTKVISNGLADITSPTIPMDELTTVAQPVGDVTEDNEDTTGYNELELWEDWTDLYTHTAPFFGVFVVQRLSTPGCK